MKWKENANNNWMKKLIVHFKSRPWIKAELIEQKKFINFSLSKQIVIIEELCLVQLLKWTKNINYEYCLQLWEN